LDEAFPELDRKTRPECFRQKKKLQGH